MSGLYEILDDRFRACFNRNAGLDRLAGGCRWCEGPAYFPAQRTLVWSDIPNDRMLRYDELNETVGIFRSPAGYTNGHTVDRQGRLVSCEHGNRRVTRTEHDGSITVIADAFAGKRLNSPNDVVVRSDGTVFFTDPSYGIDSWLEGYKAESEIGSCNVYKVDPDGAIELVADDFDRPNGLAFSLDESALYVSDSGTPRNLRIVGEREFATCTSGIFDGLRFDDAGRIWTSAGDGVHVYDPDGTLLGKVLVPEVVANVCFGGPKRNRLYICATTSLYAVLLPVRGAQTM